jgi:hypothetical protein
MRELLRVSTNADLGANKEPVRRCCNGTANIVQSTWASGMAARNSLRRPKDVPVSGV